MEVKNSRKQISGTLFVCARQNSSLAIQHVFPEFGELWSGEVPTIPCGDMHQSFTDALVVFGFFFLVLLCCDLQ